MSDIAVISGGGISQTAADARYLKLSGATAGATASRQAFTTGISIGAANGVVFGTTISLISSGTDYQLSLTADKLTLVDGDSGGTARFLIGGVTGTKDFTLPNTTGTLALTANKLSVFAATTSAELRGVISDETGTGVAVFATAPTLATPILNGLQVAVTSKSADYTALVTDHVILVDASGGVVTITLPAASASFGSNAGVEWRIKKTDVSANAVTISAAGADTVDGAASTSLTSQYQAKTIITTSTATFGVF